jgi:hypothetical protein
MHRPGHRIVVDQLDHPGDFAPSAEVDEIAEVAAAVGAKRRFRPGMGAETLDQLRRLDEGGGFEDGVLKQTSPLGMSCAALLAGSGFETAQGDA